MPEERMPARSRRVRGALLFFVGYLLSPLSWWNDAIVNLPIAWAVASAVSWRSPALFTPVLVVAYWGTNVLGILLMGGGGAAAAGGPTWTRTWWFALMSSAAYTALILLLARVGLAKPIPAFWRPHP